jgi:hypothetical protein
LRLRPLQCGVGFYGGNALRLRGRGDGALVADDHHGGYVDFEQEAGGIPAQVHCAKVIGDTVGSGVALGNTVVGVGDDDVHAASVIQITTINANPIVRGCYFVADVRFIVPFQ